MRRDWKKQIIYTIAAIAMIAVFVLVCLVVRFNVVCGRMDERMDDYFGSISETYEVQLRISTYLCNEKENLILELTRCLNAYYDEDTFRQALNGAPEDQTAMLQKICETSNVELLFVMDDAGRVLFGSRADLNGVNIVENGMLRREDFELLPRRENSYIDLTADYDQLIFFNEGKDRTVYAPYNVSFMYNGARYRILLLADYAKITEDTYGRVTGSDFVLNTGSNDEFFIEVFLDENDVENSLIGYAKHNGVDYFTKPFSALGMSRDVLRDGYKGIQRIDGKYYYCYSFKFNPLGLDTLIVAACDIDMMLDYPALILPIAVLIWFYLYLYIFGFRMRFDLPIVLPTPDLMRDTARRFFALSLVGALVVFGAGFYSETLSSLTLMVRQTEPGWEVLSSELESIYTVQSAVWETTQEIGISQANLIRTTVEANPERYFMNEDPYAYREYAVTGEGGYSESLMDDLRHPLRSVSESEGLRELCESFDLNRVTLFNADGYAVADSSDHWYAHIMRDDPETAELFEVLDRKRGAVILRSETLEGMAQVAVPVDYYVRDADGETTFVSESEYRAYRQDPENAPMVRRRCGLIVCEQKVPDILFDMENKALDFVFKSREKVQDCQFVVMDASDAYPLNYASDGIRANETADLCLPDAAFSDNYTGFFSHDGQSYFINARALRGEQMPELLAISMVPLSKLYSRRLQNALVLFAGSLVLLALLSVVLLRRARTEVRTPENHHPLIGVNRDRIASRINLGVVIFTLAAMILFTGEGWKYSSFRYILYGDWERGVNLFSLTICGLMIVALFLQSLLLKLVSRAFSLLGARGETLARLVVSTLKYAAVLIAIFYSLYLFGLDTTSVLRSLGVFSLIVGLGAQSLIKDTIAGIFVVFEGSYHVGDVVRIKTFCGKVEEIALRTTKLVDLNGNVMIFNNSAILEVENLSAHSSSVYFNLHVPISRDPAEIKEKIMAEIPAIRARIPEIISDIEYDGIMETNADGYVIRLIARCHEKDRGILWRKMNMEIIEINKKLDLL